MPQTLSQKTDAATDEYFREQITRFEAEVDEIETAWPDLKVAPADVVERLRIASTEFWRLVRAAG